MRPRPSTGASAAGKGREERRTRSPRGHSGLGLRARNERARTVGRARGQDGLGTRHARSVALRPRPHGSRRWIPDRQGSVEGSDSSRGGLVWMSGVPRAHFQLPSDGVRPVERRAFGALLELVDQDGSEVVASNAYEKGVAGVRWAIPVGGGVSAGERLEAGLAGLDPVLASERGNRLLFLHLWDGDASLLGPITYFGWFPGYEQLEARFDARALDIGVLHHRDVLERTADGVCELEVRFVARDPGRGRVAPRRSGAARLHGTCARAPALPPGLRAALDLRELDRRAAPEIPSWRREPLLPIRERGGAAQNMAPRAESSRHRSRRDGSAADRAFSGSFRSVRARDADHPGARGPNRRWRARPEDRRLRSKAQRPPFVLAGLAPGELLLSIVGPYPCSSSPPRKTTAKT